MEQQLKLKHLLVPQESVVALDKTIYEPDPAELHRINCCCKKKNRHKKTAAVEEVRGQKYFNIALVLQDE